MMGLRDGEPFGKAGSLCKPSLKAFTLLLISVCKMWVRIRPGRRGLVSLLHRNSAYLCKRAALASSQDTLGAIDKYPVLIQSCRSSNVLSTMLRAAIKSAWRV